MLKLLLICYYFLSIGVFYYPVKSDNNCQCIRENDCTDTAINNIILPRLNACSPGEVCCYYPKDINERENQEDLPVNNNNVPPIDPDLKDECGYRYEVRTGVGNYNQFRNGEAKLGEFPWMVSFVLDNKAQCGGTLLSPSVVITAAHCLERKPINSFNVRAGDWDLSKTNEPFKHKSQKIKEILIHPDYKNIDLANDIALVFLKQPFVFNSFINSICLPAPNENSDLEKCLASGWGKYDLNSSYANILKKVDDLAIIPHDVCNTMLKTNTRLPPSFNLHDSFTCAGGEEGKDMCKGDGGSPLMCPSRVYKGQYILAGVVSWGVGCNRKNVPGVYVNVAKFKDWIDQQIIAKGYENERIYYSPVIKMPDYDDDEDDE